MSTDTTPGPYGDPTEWDEIPPGWLEKFATALAAHGHTVTGAHDAALTVDVPGLDDGQEWMLVKPNFHGVWAYGVYLKNHCPNPTWIFADAADPTDIADTVHGILTGAPLARGHLSGLDAVWLETEGAPAGDAS